MKYINTLIFLIFSFEAAAAVLSTEFDVAAERFTNLIRAYAKDNNGAYPTAVGQIKRYETDVGGRASVQVEFALVGQVQPFLVGSSERRLVAYMTSPVNDDRKPEIGRYIVYRLKTGEFYYKWEPDKKIKVMLASINTTLPEGAALSIGPLRHRYPEYSIKLIEAGVAQGMDQSEATDLVRKHVENIDSGKETPVDSWQQLTDSVRGASASVNFGGGLHEKSLKDVGAGDVQPRNLPLGIVLAICLALLGVGAFVVVLRSRP